MLKKLKSTTSIDRKITGSLRIAIVRTDYHANLIDNLEKYCVKTLAANGVKKENIKILTAPGSWEVPLIARTAAKSKKFDAIVTFGVIVKGVTYHFEMLANECARALMRISLEHSIPIALEILAVNNIKQAEERAGDDEKNKGIEGATAVLKTISTLWEIKNNK